MKYGNLHFTPSVNEICLYFYLNPTLAIDAKSMQENIHSGNGGISVFYGWFCECWTGRSTKRCSCTRVEEVNSDTNSTSGTDARLLSPAALDLTETKVLSVNLWSNLVCQGDIVSFLPVHSLKVHVPSKSIETKAQTSFSFSTFSADFPQQGLEITLAHYTGKES